VQAIDTNILVTAEVESSPRHVRASELLKRLAEGATPWALPWPCVYEFLGVVTHTRVFHPPVPLEVALDDLERILGSPSLVLLGETELHASILDRTIRKSGVTGNLIHDAHIAALCLEHGVSELITGDRDFSRFEGLRIINPFADGR
jgi:uncharacterized protein